MHDFPFFQKLIEEEIRNLSLPEQPSELYDPIRYMLTLGGKRIRPVLVLMSCEMFDGNISNAIHPAIGIEVFHNFTLLHDDIMDKAPLRRSKPTVHTRWNTDVAILSGDTMFVQACQLMLKTDQTCALPMMRHFLETAVKVCEGQQWDMSYQTAPKVSIPEYLNMIELKTAVLLASSLKCGAMIAKATEEDQQHIYDFGKNLGIAFQLHDDILDVYGDEQKVGKQTGGDIIANKKTYLLLKAQEVGTKDQQEELAHWLTVEKFDQNEKVKAVKNIFEKVRVKELSKEVMEQYFNKAIEAFDKISVASEKKSIVESLAETLMIREK